MIYRDYDQAGLDAQYNLRTRHADYLERYARYAELSAQARGARNVLLDVDYGPATAPSSVADAGGAVAGTSCRIEAVEA